LAKLRRESEERRTEFYHEDREEHEEEKRKLAQRRRAAEKRKKAFIIKNAKDTKDENCRPDVSLLRCLDGLRMFKHGHGNVCG
jgi:hypothetical protein